MKKFLAFIMILCLLMTAFAAVAEETGIRPVLQDEQPPMLVVGEDQALAKICDANGNVLAVISSDNVLHMTDVHHRDMLHDEKTITRLDHAYDQLMHDVHFGDVKADDGEKLLKDTINERIADDDLSAYDLLVYEVFDVHLNDPEVAALLTEGAYLEITIELTEEQTAPMLIKFSEDGEHWALLDNFVVEGKQVTIRLNKQGVLGLIKPYEVLPGTSNSYIVPVKGTETLEMMEEQNIFRPSVTGKPAPQLVPVISEENEIILGYLYITNSTEPIVLKESDHLVITPVSESFYVEDITTHEHLQWSFDAMLEAEEVQNIRTGIGEEIDQQLAAGGFDMNHANLIMRDLFEITLYGDKLELFYQEGTLMELTFEEPELDPSQPLVVIHSFDSINWHVVPAEQVEVNDDGTVTLKLDGLGTVAFLVPKADQLPAGEMVSSPE